VVVARIASRRGGNAIEPELYICADDKRVEPRLRGMPAMR